MSFLRADTDFPSDIFFPRSRPQAVAQTTSLLFPLARRQAVRIVGPGADLGRLARLHCAALMPLPSMGGGGGPGALAGRLNHFFGNACPGWSDPPSAGEPGSQAEFTAVRSGEDVVQSEEPLGPRTAFPGR